MKKRKQLNTIGIFIFLIFFIACAVPKDIRERMTYCYDGSPTSIDSLINIDGYYQLARIWDSEKLKIPQGLEQKVDTQYINLMFYIDGTFLFHFHNYEQEIPEYFKDVNEKLSNGERHSFHEWGNWGKYIICGDTIKAQYINNSKANTWIAFETWYKVIDRNTIQEIARKKLYYDEQNQDKSVMDLRVLSEKDQDIATFITLDIIPNSNCWLKEEKWFLCDSL